MALTPAARREREDRLCADLIGVCTRLVTFMDAWDDHQMVACLNCGHTVRDDRPCVHCARERAHIRL